MKSIKNLFTALLLLCSSVIYAHDFEVDGIFYNITNTANKTVEVTYAGTSSWEYSDDYTGSVVIPESVTYNGTTYGVTSIGYSAFCDCFGLTSVEIPNSVTSIGTWAFDYCKGLTSIVIPNSVTSIGDYAFRDCENLASIVIGERVTSIGNYAFRGCTGLKTVYNFSNLTFSKGSSSNGCVAYYADKVYNAPNGSIEGDFIFGKPNGVNTLLYYLGNAAELTLPTDYNGENYAVGANAFNGNTTITSIVIPNSVTSIGSSAFDGCTSLKELCIADGEGTLSLGYNGIGEGLFYDCPLETLYLGRDLSYDTSSSYDYSPFYNKTTLTSVTISNSVTSIGSYAFRGCSGLEYIVVDENNTKYDSRENCNAIIETKTNTLILGCMNTIIPNSVTSIGVGAFYYCYGLTSIEIPNSVTNIGDYAFYYCSGLTSIEIPNSVTSIGEYAFSGCDGLTSIEIPNSVTSIGNSAFRGCDGLTSIVIPNSVTSIDDNAFYYCTGLKIVYNFSNITFSKGSTENGYVAYYADKVINAPNGFIDGDFIWFEKENGMTLAGYLGNATELTLPADYNGENYAIGANVFNGNTTITSVTIPNSVTNVEDDAFTGCSNVEKLDLNCAEIGNWFSGVSALKEVTIGDGVTSVVASAFNGCTGLEKVCISNLAAWCGIDFASADANPLYYAKNLYLNGEQLTNLTIPAEIVEVKDYAFYNCKGVTNINIVDKIKSIGNSAFYGCSDLETLYISNTIESIDDYAFAECNDILDIKIGSKKAITASENVFSSDAYINACLYVPNGRKFAYEKATPWGKFYIVEMDFTGIDAVDEQRTERENIYYDLNGRAVENPTKGIYILNGKKVLVK